MNIPREEVATTFLEQIYEYNSWIKKGSLTLIREYSSYEPKKNLIYECNNNIRSKVLKKEIIRIGLDEYRCYPDIDLLQCFNCCQYWHIAKVCKNKAACKKCGEEHHYKNCKKENPRNCTLCAHEGRNMDGRFKGHTVTSGNCPVRIERMNEVIQKMIKY